MNDYLLRLRMRDREREILKDFGMGGYHALRRRGGTGLSKKNACRLQATFFRFKGIPDPRPRRQQATDGKDRYASWKKEFS